MSGWTLTIPGPPVSKERPRRASAGHWYTPTKTQRAEQTVAEYAMAAGVRLEAKKRYALEVTFRLSSHRRDLDNLTKLVMDGLNRLDKDWDDSQIDSLLVRVVGVRDGSEEQTFLVIREVEE
jgi:Holliday junction resolvase RusA-like endonuclease